MPAASLARKPRVNHAESPLQWLSRRKTSDGEPMITEAQRAAGERLRADFERGHMAARVTVNWAEPVGRQGGARALSRAGLEPSERAAAARERVRRALAAVGPELSGILVDVCCHLIRLEDVERAFRWPQRSAKLVLRLALTSLARHYGLIAPLGRPDRGEGLVRHWGAPDYRPAAGDAPS